MNDDIMCNVGIFAFTCPTCKQPLMLFRSMNNYTIESGNKVEYGIENKTLYCTYCSHSVADGIKIESIKE